MADLNIPKLNMKSEKYIFKKKLTLRRKSNRRILTEFSFMFFLSILIYINYLITKNLLLKNIPKNINKSFELIIELFSNLLEIFLVFFIFISGITTLILLAGSFYRLYKVVRKKTKHIDYK